MGQLDRFNGVRRRCPAGNSQPTQVGVPCASPVDSAFLEPGHALIRMAQRR